MSAASGNTGVVYVYARAAAAAAVALDAAAALRARGRRTLGASQNGDFADAPPLLDVVLVVGAKAL